MMRALLAALLLGAAAPAAAQDTLITDRPDFTESVAVVSPGRVQLEGGYTFTRTGDEEEHALGELLLRFPLSERVEARVGVNSYVWNRVPGARTDGFEDASLGFKLRLTNPSPRPGLRPEVALLAVTTLPTGTDASSANAWQPESKVALGWTLSERTGLGSNLGYTYAVDEGGRFHEGSASLALGYTLTERISSYVEAFGFVPSGDGRESTAFLNGGLTHLLSADVQLDLRGGIGLAEARPNYFAGVGIAHRW